MRLKRRIDRVEQRLVPPPPPPPPVLSAEDRAIAERIYHRTYADPVRYAKRIELFERIHAEQRQREAQSRQRR